MFGARDIFGWRAVGGPALLALAATAFVLAVNLQLGLQFALIIALAPLAGVIALNNTFLFAALLASFSYFRLHEAYPFFTTFRPVALCGAAVIAGLMVRAFLVDGNSPRGQRELKVVSLISAAMTIVFIFAVGDPLNFETAVGFALALVALFSFCATLASWHQLLGRASPEGWPPLMNYFVLFSIVATIGVALSPYGYDAYSHWSIVWTKICILTFALAWLARSTSDFNTALLMIIVTGGLIASVAISNKINGVDLVEGTRVTIGLTLLAPADAIQLDPNINYGGSLGDPNELAIVLLFALSFCLAALYYRPSPLVVLLGAIVAPALLLAIIYTESRGGMLGVLAVMGAIGLRVVKNKALLIGAGVVVGMVLFAAMGLSERAVVIDGGGVDESSMGRLYAWLASFKMVAAYPITGVGMMAFNEAHEEFAILLTGFNKAAHSTWFGVFGETGVPGTIIFAVMLISALRTAWSLIGTLEEKNADPRLRTTALGLFAGLVGFCVAGSFLTHGFTWPLYIQIGLIVALWRIERRLAREANERANSEQGWRPIQLMTRPGRTNDTAAPA